MTLVGANACIKRTSTFGNKRAYINVIVLLRQCLAMHSRTCQCFTTYLQPSDGAVQGTHHFDVKVTHALEAFTKLLGKLYKCR